MEVEATVYHEVNNICMLIYPITGRRANVRQRNDNYLNVTKDNYSLIDWIHSLTFCCCCKACVLFAADSKMKPLLAEGGMKLHKFDSLRCARRGTARHTRAQQGYRLSCLVALGTYGAWTKLKSALSDLPCMISPALPRWRWAHIFGQRNAQANLVAHYVMRSRQVNWKDETQTGCVCSCDRASLLCFGEMMSSMWSLDTGGTCR